MMTPHNFGPWTTSLDAGSRLGLSAFWKRRLEILPTLRATTPRRKRSAAAAGAFILALAATPLLAVSDDPKSAAKDKPDASSSEVHAAVSREQLAASAESDAKYGEVIERTVNDNGHGRYLIDFDSGELYKEPEDRDFDSEREFLAWMRSRGVDAMGQIKSSYKGLVGFDMIVIPADSDSWDKRPGGVVESLEIGDLGSPALMDARAGLPATFFIETREGTRGVLQIVSISDDNNSPGPDNVRIRFKPIASPNKRLVFRPAAGKENGADWSPLFRMKEGGGAYLLMAHVPVGGKFPVCLAGTETPLFSVQLVKGSDQALSVQVIPPAGDPQRLWLERDEPVDVVLGGEKYTLSYPTSQVAADSLAVTDKAMIMVSWRPAADGQSPDHSDLNLKPPKKDPASKKPAPKKPTKPALDQGSDLLRRLQKAGAPHLRALADKHGYALTDDQVLRRVAPPFAPARMNWYQAANATQSEHIPAGPDSMLFYWKNGALENRGMSFGGHDLEDVLHAVAQVYPQDIVATSGLRDLLVPGDWIVREAAPREMIVAQLQEILNRELSLGVQLRFSHVDLDAYVVRGDYKFTPLPGQDAVDETQLLDRISRTDPIQVVGSQLNPDSGYGGGTGDFDEFCEWVGRWIGAPIVSEAAGAPREITWRLHGPRPADSGKIGREAELVLANIAKQTGLEFTKEKRPVEVLVIERAQ